MAAIKMKTTVKYRLAANCPSHSRADIGVRDLNFSIDEPIERGGTNFGPAPTEAALASLVGCLNVIGHKCAEKLGADIGELTIDLVGDFDRRGAILAEEIELPFPAISATVRSTGDADQETLDRVGAEVEKYCPLSKLFVNAGTKLDVKWLKG